MMRNRYQQALPHSTAPNVGSKAKRQASNTIWSICKRYRYLSLLPLLLALVILFIHIVISGTSSDSSHFYYKHQYTHNSQHQQQYHQQYHSPTPHGESSSIPIRKGDTVIGFGADYNLKTYRQFIGSLRNTGFTGNIIIGMGSYDGYQYDKTTNKNTNKNLQIHIDPIARREILSYLQEQNVSVHMIPVTDKCKPPHARHININDNDICLEELQEWKLAWGSFFLARKWLRDCKVCHPGQVLMVPVHSTFFLQSPFPPSLQGREREPSIGLDLYETQFVTDNWRVNMFLDKCKGFRWDVPLLSSAVVKGDGMSVLYYLETMVGEMYNWAEEKKCCSSLHGNEMAMHNYLFYNGEIRAKVHTPSSNFVALVPKGVAYENNVNEGTRVVVALDGPNGNFSSWVATKQDVMVTREKLHSSPLQEMAMEYFDREDFAVLNKWMVASRQ